VSLKYALNLRTILVFNPTRVISGFNCNEINTMCQCQEKQSGIYKSKLISRLNDPLCYSVSLCTKFSLNYFIKNWCQLQKELLLQASFVAGNIIRFNFYYGILTVLFSFVI
jgi:hypothetical protein